MFWHAERVPNFLKNKKTKKKNYCGHLRECDLLIKNTMFFWMGLAPLPSTSQGQSCSRAITHRSTAVWGLDFVLCYVRGFPLTFQVSTDFILELELLRANIKANKKPPLEDILSFYCLCERALGRLLLFEKQPWSAATSRMCWWYLWGSCFCSQLMEGCRVYR